MHGQDSRIDVYLTECYRLYNIIMLSNSNNRLEMNEIFLLKIMPDMLSKHLYSQNFPGGACPQTPLDV